MRFSASSLTALLVAAPAVAQITVSDGNVAYTQLAISPSQSDSPSANYTTGGADTDVLFEDGWFYRIEGDATNSALKDDGTLTVVNAGTHADADWTDVDNRGLISISMDFDAVSTGADSGTVVTRVIVKNISASPVTVHLFRYVDLDVSTTTNQVSGTGNRHSIANTISSDVYEFYGAAPDHHCVAAFSGSECGIVGGSGDLDDSAPPFTGDYSGAFQWTCEDIPPNPTVDRVVTSALSGQDSSCAWGYDVYGTSSPGSSGTITTEPDYRFPPVIGGATVATGIYRNWPSGADLFWCKGIRRANITFPGIAGTTLHVEPLICGGPVSGAPAAFAFVFNGFFPNNPALCGLEVHVQLFAADPGAPNGFVGNPKPSTWVIGDAAQ